MKKSKVVHITVAQARKIQGDCDEFPTSVAIRNCAAHVVSIYESCQQIRELLRKEQTQFLEMRHELENLLNQHETEISTVVSGWVDKDFTRKVSDAIKRNCPR